VLAAGNQKSRTKKQERAEARSDSSTSNLIRRYRQKQGERMKSLGYDKPLYVLPFDHRGSFQTKRRMARHANSGTNRRKSQRPKAKVIYDGFLAALKWEYPRRSGIWSTTIWLGGGRRIPRKPCRAGHHTTGVSG